MGISVNTPNDARTKPPVGVFPWKVSYKPWTIPVSPASVPIKTTKRRVLLRLFQEKIPSCFE